jgi:hypothetical protein
VPRAKSPHCEKKRTTAGEAPKTALLNGGSALQLPVVDTPDQSVDP